MNFIANQTYPVTGVTLTPSTATFPIGSTQQLTTTVAPINATNKTVSYTSTNTAVATVNSSGLVTGVGAGTATITVKTADGNFTATATITVNNISVTGVTLTPSSASLPIGSTQQLTTTVAPVNATNKTVSYTSTNTAVATVNSSGLVKGVSAGTATITVKTADGNFTATATITVNNISVTGVTLTPSSASLPIGSTQQLTATVAPVNATNKAVSYTSSNTAVVSVNSSGLVTGLAAGSATITVKTADGSFTASTIITVNTIPVSGVTISPTTTSVAKGATRQLTATVAPSNATNKNVTYRSSNTTIATVNSTGLVTGIAVGSATITVTTQDGGKTATSAITVTTAAPIVYPGIYSIFNQNCLNAGFKRGLDQSGTTSGANTQIYDVSTGGGGNNQRWRLDDAGNGQYFIRVKSNLHRLDLKTRSTSNNIQVVTRSSSTNTSQKWTVTDIGGGYVKIINVFSGKALEVAGSSTANGALVRQNTYTGAPNQHWQLFQVESTKTASLTTKSSVRESEINVYPNPTEDYLNVSGVIGASVVIYTTEGKIVYKIDQSESHNLNLSVKEWSKGMYIIQIHNQYESITKKIIVN